MIFSHKLLTLTLVLMLPSVVDAGAILYRVPAMAEPVYQDLENKIKKNSMESNMNERRWGITWILL